MSLRQTVWMCLCGGVCARCRFSIVFAFSVWGGGSFCIFQTVILYWHVRSDAVVSTVTATDDGRSIRSVYTGKLFQPPPPPTKTKILCSTVYVVPDQTRHGTARPGRQASRHHSGHINICIGQWKQNVNIKAAKACKLKWYIRMATD